MLKIYYCNGFASQFDPCSEKLRILSNLGEINGHDIDYTLPADVVVKQCIDKLMGCDIDIIVGTSMGGWLAAAVGSSAGIPFVAINPAINPSRTLIRHVGKGVDYQGNEYQLTASVVNSYGPLARDGCGLILLDEGDDVFDWHETYVAYHETYSIYSFPGGSHRFEHMKESLQLIEKFFNHSECVYGLDEG